MHWGILGALAVEGVPTQALARSGRGVTAERAVEQADEACQRDPYHVVPLPFLVHRSSARHRAVDQLGPALSFLR